MLAIYSRTYFRNLEQRSTLARKGTFYEKGKFFLKKEPQNSHRPPYQIPFLIVLHQNKPLHNFRKKRQLSIAEHNINLKYALPDSLSKPRSLYIDSLSKRRQSTSGIIGNCSKNFFYWSSLMGRSLFLVYKAHYKKNQNKDF